MPTLAGLGDRGEIDHPGVVAVLVAVPAGGLDGEPGLAGAAGTEHGDQAPGGEQRVDPGEVVVAPDEAGQRRRQVARPGPRGVGGRGGPPGAQQTQVALAQCGARVGAEHVGQGFADPLVQGQGLGLATLGGERVHEQRGHPLVDGVLGEQGGQAGGGRVGAAQRQLRVGEVGDGFDRGVGQPGRGGGRYCGDGRGLGAGTAAPQRHGLGEQGRRGIRVAGAHAVTAGGGELLEPQRVHVGRVHVEPVAAGDLRDVTGRAEGPAQPRDQGLQGVGGAGRRVLGPDRVDQDALLDRSPAGERQPYEQAL